jgi:hypothetical protein
MAMIASRREAAYRLMSLQDGPGYAVQSQAAWGEALMSSPEALSFFLESLRQGRAGARGAILEERVTSAAC